MKKKRERSWDKKGEGERVENERNRKTRSSSTVYRLDPSFSASYIFERWFSSHCEIRFLRRKPRVERESAREREREGRGEGCPPRKGMERRRRSLGKRGGRKGSFFLPSLLLLLPLLLLLQQQIHVLLLDKRPLLLNRERSPRPVVVGPLITRLLVVGDEASVRERERERGGDSRLPSYILEIIWNDFLGYL